MYSTDSEILAKYQWLDILGTPGRESTEGFHESTTGIQHALTTLVNPCVLRVAQVANFLVVRLHLLRIYILGLYGYNSYQYYIFL